MPTIAHRPTPRWTTLRPHEKQQEYYRSTARVNVVPAGRRCLVAGTLVATPAGPVSIEKIKVGDEIIGFEEGSPSITKVSAVFDNGVQKVVPLEHDGAVYVCGTEKHKLWAAREEEEDFQRCAISEFETPHAVCTKYADGLIKGGGVSFPLAYGTHIHNVKWGVIDTWSRESCLLYLAGVLDSCLHSYSICEDNKHVDITLCLFDDHVFECCLNIIFKYFQENVTKISKCSEQNVRCVRYLFGMRMTNNLISRILLALNGIMVKHINIPGIYKVCTDNDRMVLTRQKRQFLAQTYDITVSNSTNLYMLHNGGIITSNSGKCVARGTMVSMADNTFKPVEQVKRGDYVWSMEQYGTFIPQKVTEAELDSIRACLRFRTWAGTVDVSPNHPFLVMDGSWRERRERWYAKLYNKPIPRSARWKDADQLKVGDMVGIAGTCSTYAIELEQFEDREIDMTLMWQVAHNLHIDVLEPLQGNLLKAFFVTYNRMYAYKHGEVLKEPIIKAIGEKVTKYPMRMLFERMRVFKHNFPIVKDTKTFGEEVGGSVIWLPILSISDTAQQEVYDLTVNETHNFVANGYVTHNTEIAKRRVVRRALARVIQGNGKYHNGRFFTAAPTRDQAKRIYWNDLKALIPSKYFDGRPKETELMIPLKNNVQIHVIGMDKPERFEGTPWDGGILDEYGNMKESAWMENVFPALADRQGWVDLIGVPEGRNHYYDRWLEAVSCTDGSIRGHHWTSAEILPPEEIAMAKRMLDELSYKQEMEAEFVNFAGQCYYQFNVADHCHTLSYDKRAPLIFCFDFNVSPGVAAVIQEQVIPGSFELVQKPQYGSGVDGFARALKVGPEAMVKVPVVGTGIIGEVHIRNNSNTPAVCNKLIQDWGDHEGSILLYGDATGGSRGTAKVSGSDWDLIWSIMCSHYGESRVFMEVPQTNPSERNRINAVNTRLKSLDGTVRMAVDPDYCENIIRDFEGVRVLEGGAGEIDKKHDRMLSHLSDSIGYYVSREFPVLEESVGSFRVGGRF